MIVVCRGRLTSQRGVSGVLQTSLKRASERASDFSIGFRRSGMGDMLIQVNRRGDGIERAVSLH